MLASSLVVDSSISLLSKEEAQVLLNGNVDGLGVVILPHEENEKILTSIPDLL